MLPFKRHKAAPIAPHLHWTYTKIAPGHSLFGWIAGRVVVVKTHWFGGCSKPCWIELIEGQTFCPYCDPAKGLIPNCKAGRYTGYTPLIDRSGKRCVISVSETLGPKVEYLVPGTQVEFNRSDGARDPLRLKLFSQLEQKPCPERIPNLSGYDISEWLVRLWADDSLTQLLTLKDPALTSTTQAERTTEQIDSSATLSEPRPGGDSPPGPRPPGAARPAPPPPPIPTTAVYPGGLAAELARRQSAEQVEQTPPGVPIRAAHGISNAIEKLVKDLADSTKLDQVVPPDKPPDPPKKRRSSKK